MDQKSRKNIKRTTRIPTRQKKRTEKEIIEKLVKEINSQPNEFARHLLLQFLLVRSGARKAYFFDDTGDAENVKKTIERARSFGLHVKKDPTTSDENPGYWIYQRLDTLPKTDKEVGTVLGFLQPLDGTSFGNFRNRRVSLHISEKTTKTHLTSEILVDDTKDMRDLARQKVQRFDQHMIERDLPYRFKYEIDVEDGTLQRMEKLEQGDKEYLVKHRKHYLNDLENIFDKPIHPLITLFKQMIQDQPLRKKYTPLFLHIYKMFNKWMILTDKQLETIYKKFIELC